MTVDSLWPTSVGGWVGLVSGVIALLLLLTDRLTARGRSLARIDGKIDDLCEKVNDMESRLDVVDGLAASVRELTQEWRGVAGDNGYRSIIRENNRRIAAIEKRNDRLDAIREAREEDERRGGGQHRRHLDRELDRILPEKKGE